MGKMSMSWKQTKQHHCACADETYCKDEDIYDKTAENTKEHFREFRTVDQSASFKIKCKQWKDVICGAVTCKPDADAFVQWYGDGCGTCGKTVGKVFKNGWYFRI